MGMSATRKYTFSLKELEGFAEIMRTGSATAAAKRLGLSQPAVSRLVQQLEEEIGFELFYRDRGRLIPTKDGIALLDEVELALAGLARVSSLVDDINTNATGEIRIMAPPSFAEAVAPSIIAAFVARYPGVRVSIDSRSIGTTKTMLTTRVVDCAFMRLPIEHDDLRAEPMVTSRTICVVPVGHPLAGLPMLSPELIADAPIVSLGAGLTYGLQIEEAFRDRSCRQRIAVETHTTSSACALARKGVGIAIVNELLATAYLADDVVQVPFEPAISHHYAFVTSALTPESRLVCKFREVAAQCFADRELEQ